MLHFTKNSIHKGFHFLGNVGGITFLEECGLISRVNPEIDSIGDIPENITLRTPEDGIVAGNSFIKNQNYVSESQYDTEHILYDIDGNPKTFNITGNEIVKNQLFISVDRNEVLFFDKQLDSDCLTAVLLELDFIIPVEVEEGIVQIDEGVWYVLREDVKQS